MPSSSKWRRVLPVAAVCLLMIIGAYTSSMFTGAFGAATAPTAHPGHAGVTPLAGVPPTLTLTPAKGVVGSSVNAQLRGMLPNAAVTVTWPGAGTVCTGSTGPYGQFACTITVPGLAGSTYTLTATDGASSPTATFQILPSATVAPATAPADSYVTATGVGYSASASVTVRYDGVSVCTATATATGTFTCTFLTFPTASEFPNQFVNITSGSTTVSVPFTVAFPTSGAGTFYGTSGVPLPALASRSCSVPLTAGACTATGINNPKTGKPTVIAPYLNVSNDPALNYTSTGFVAMAYTSYTTTTAPCAAAKPYSLSNIAVQTSANYGGTWTNPVYLGTNAASSVCSGRMTYPSAWEPAITSLSNGTLVLAYVEYNATAPNLPPFYAVNGTRLPSVSQLVVTESYPGTGFGTVWTPPTVLNVSNSNPSLTVQFAPVEPSLAAFGNTIYLAWMSMWAVGSAPVLSHVALIVSTNGGGAWSPTISIGSASVNTANPKVLVVPATIGSVAAGTLYVAYDSSVAINSTTGHATTASVVIAKSAANGTSFTTTTVASGIAATAMVGPFFNPAPVPIWTSAGALDLAFIGGRAAVGGTVSSLYFYTAAASTGGSFSASPTAGRLFSLPNVAVAGLKNTSSLLTLAGTSLALNPTGTVSLEATVYNGTACNSQGCGVLQEMALSTTTNGATWTGPSVVSGWFMPNGSAGVWNASLIGEYESVLSFPGTGGNYQTMFAWVNASCPSYTAYPSSVLGQCGTFGTLGVNQTTLWGTTQVQVSSAWTGATTSVTFSPKAIPAGVSWSVSIGGLTLVSTGGTPVTVTNVPVGVPVSWNLSAQGQFNASYQYKFASESPGSPAVFTAAAATVNSVFAAWVLLTVQAAPSFLTGPDCNTGYGCTPGYFGPPPAFLNPNLGGPAGVDISGCPSISPRNYYGTCTSGCVGYIYDESLLNWWYQYVDDYALDEVERGAEFEGMTCSNAMITHNQTTGPGTIVPLNTPIWVPTGTTYNLNVSYWNPMNVLCGQNKPAVTNLTPFNYQTGTIYYLFLDMYCEDIQELQLDLVAWFGSGAGSITGTNSSIMVTAQGPLTEIADFNIAGQCAGSYAYYEYEWYYPTSTAYPYSYNATTCGPYTQSVTVGGAVPLNFTETGLPKGTTWGVTLTNPNNNVSVTGNKPTILTQGDSALTYNILVDTIPAPSGKWWVGTTVATVSPPDFNPIMVSFTEVSSLSGSTFSATTTATGLPSGTPFSFGVKTASGTTTYSVAEGWTGMSSPGVTFNLQGSSTFSLNGSYVYLTNGTAYYVSSIEDSFATINTTGGAVAPGSLITMVGAAALVLVYSVEFQVTIQATSGGTATPASQWVALGQPLTMTAAPSTGYEFTGWTGYGNGSVTTHGPTPLMIRTLVGSPITEIANFRLIPQPTFTLTVSAANLPAGLSYSLILNGQAYTGTGTFVIANLTAGTYTLGSADVYASPVPDTRWVPQMPITTSYGGSSGGPITIGSDGTATVSFSVQYLLSVSTTIGGTVTGAESGPWYASGASVTLTAVPNPGVPGVGYYFIGWNGTGASAQSVSSISITLIMNTPVGELAQFQLKPVPPPRTFILTVNENGLPTGDLWNASVGMIGNSTNTSSIEIAGLNASYTLNVPVVQGVPGVRYNSSEVAGTVNLLGQNQTVNVTFTTQYKVTVESAGDGTASSAGVQWVNSGTTLTLTATVTNSSWQFSSWKGTQTGAAASLPITVSQPTTEVAQFVPTPVQTSTGSSTAGLPIALALLIVLLVVGVVVAYVISRPGGGSSKGKAEPAAPVNDGMAAETAEPAGAASSPGDDGAVESEP
jgi:hypothetical protein